MKRIVCTVQESQFSKREIRKLEAGLKEIYKNNYSEEKLGVIWMIMPSGYAFSERKLSKATIILVEVDSDIEQEKRENLMHLFSDFLLKEFSISPLDLVLSVANSSYLQQYATSQTRRVHPNHRRRIRFKSKFTAIKSKMLNGYSRMNIRV